MGTNSTGERADSPVSLPRPGSHTEGDGVDTGVSQTYSRDPSPYPEPVAAGEDRLGDPRRKKVDVGEEGVGQSCSRLDPDVKDATGSGPGREVKRASSPLSVSPITPEQELDSTWTSSLQQLCLITLLDKTSPLAVPDHVQGVPLSDENAEPSAIANEKKSSWKSTAFFTAKTLLRGVRDSSDAFGPLKAVAGGLHLILENCEVLYDPCLHYHSSDRCPSE